MTGQQRRIDLLDPAWASMCRERVLGGLRIESLGCYMDFHEQMVGFHDRTEERAMAELRRMESTGLHVGCLVHRVGFFKMR
jgi:hypothetical protein